MEQHLHKFLDKEKRRSRRQSYKARKKDREQGQDCLPARVVGDDESVRIMQDDILPDELLLHIFGQLSWEGELKDIARLQLVCRRWNAIARTEDLWRCVWINNCHKYGPAQHFNQELIEDETQQRWPAFVANMRCHIEAYLQRVAYEEGWCRYITAFLEGKNYESEVDSSPHTHYFAKSFYILFRFHPNGVAERLCYSHLDLRTHERSYRPITYHHKGTYTVELRDETSFTEGTTAAHGAEQEEWSSLKPTCHIVVVLTLPSLMGSTLRKEFYLVDDGKRLDAGNSSISYVQKKHVNKLGQRARLFLFNVSEKRKQKKMLRLQRRSQAIFFEHSDTDDSDEGNPS